MVERMADGQVAETGEQQPRPDGHTRHCVGQKQHDLEDRVGGEGGAGHTLHVACIRKVSDDF